MITLTVSLDINGKSKHIQAEMTRGDFTTGAAHIHSAYLDPMSELLLEAYRQLTAEENPAHRDMLDERATITKRLAAIGMV